MVGAVVRTRPLMVLNDAPSESIRMSRARKNIPGGQGTGLRNAAKFQMLIFTEDYLMAIHANLDVNRTSNVYSPTGH